MKAITILFFLAIHSPAPLVAQEVVQQIEFTKSSRGFREQMIIKSDSVSLTIEDARSSTQRKQVREVISGKTWRRLLAILKPLSLKEIPLYESPTMKRAHDGALHGSLTITTAQGASYSHAFDDENPHAHLRPLMKCIVELRKTMK